MVYLPAAILKKIFSSRSSLILLITLLCISMVSGQETGALFSPTFTLTGHRDYVLRSVFSPDGQTVVTGSADTTAMVWDVKTGELRHTLSGHTQGIIAITIAPDGRTLVTGSHDTNAILWDIQTGEQRHVLSGHRDSVRAVAFSPDGRTVVTASADKMVMLWDVETGQRLSILSGHAAAVNDVAFSPDGSIILTGSSDFNGRLWNARNGRRLLTLSGHENEVTDVAFSPDGQMAITAGDDGAVIIWDIKTGQVLHKLMESVDPILDFAISPDGKRLFTGSAKKTVLWDIESETRLHIFTDHTDQINIVAFSPDGQRVLSASLDGTALLTNVDTGELIQILTISDRELFTAAYAPDGKTVLTGGAERAALLWDVSGQDGSQGLSNMPPVLSPSYILEGYANGIAFAPDSKTVMTKTANTITIWDIETGEGQESLNGGSDSFWDGVLSPDRRFLLSGNRFKGYEQPIKLWDTQSGNLLYSLSDKRLLYGAFSPDSQTVVTVDYDDYQAEVWDVQTGEKRLTLDGTMWVAEFSPDGKSILTGEGDGNVYLWDAQTGQQRQSFVGHTAAVTAAAFSPDGQTIVTSGTDALIGWDVKTGDQIFNAYYSADTIEFSPDGTTILTVNSWDHGAYLWDAATGERRYQLSGIVGAFSADGTRVVTGTQATRVLVWDVETGALLYILRGHSDSLTSVAISPDGQTIMTGSYDGRMMLWNMSSED